MTIPKIIHRVVPEHSPEEAERFWEHVKELHPSWTSITHRDPLSPDAYPMTSPYWHLVKNGAQLAGLVRLEVLWTFGGIYLDQDVELYRPLDPLLHYQAFAAYEDRVNVPDAVLGSVPNHPAFLIMLNLAIERLQAGAGARVTGPQVSTDVLIGRDDVHLLPPVSFYPYLYTEKQRRHDPFWLNPATYGAHHWYFSWASEYA